MRPVCGAPCVHSAGASMLRRTFCGVNRPMSFVHLSSNQWSTRFVVFKGKIFCMQLVVTGFIHSIQAASSFDPYYAITVQSKNSNSFVDDDVDYALVDDEAMMTRMPRSRTYHDDAQQESVTELGYFRCAEEGGELLKQGGIT